MELVSPADSFSVKQLALIGGFVLGAIGLVLVGALLLRRLEPGVEVSTDFGEGCQQAPLTAHSDWLALRHGNWFESSVDPAGPRYTILDLRTRLAYRWTESRDATGSRFEVRTRWALSHPGWTTDPWVLVYNC
jgi:hypothetical protein